MIVASTTTEIEETLDATRRFVLLASIVAALLAAALATVLPAGRSPAAAPVDGAREIERTGDASRRLPEPAGARRGRHARGDAERHARLARARPRGRAALRRRRVARAAHAADRAARQRGLRRAPRRRPRGARRHRGRRRSARTLLDDLLALAREDAAAPGRGEPVDLAELARVAAAPTQALAAPARVRGERPRSSAPRQPGQNARKHGPGRLEIAMSGTTATAHG